MPRNDGIRYGAGGQAMQEIVEEPKPTKTLTKKEDKEVQVLEERLVEMPVEVESEEQEDEEF
jgi:GH24 family phage-related lysozyme (muramidase)